MAMHNFPCSVLRRMYTCVLLHVCMLQNFALHARVHSITCACPSPCVRAEVMSSTVVNTRVINFDYNHGKQHQKLQLVITHHLQGATLKLRVTTMAHFMMK